MCVVKKLGFGFGLVGVSEEGKMWRGRREGRGVQDEKRERGVE